MVKRQPFFLTEKEARRQIKRLKRRLRQNPLEVAKGFHQDRARKCAFLSAFSECGNVALAMRACGIPGTFAVHRWRKTDKEFNRQYKRAEEYAIAVLELEARRRAMDGTRKLVLFKGQPVYVPEDPTDKESPLVPVYDTQYSDELLKLLLRAHMPDKYREKVDVTSHGEISYKQVKSVKGVSTDDL